VVPDLDEPAAPDGPDVLALLHAAVAEIGGSQRPGQDVMAQAVAEAFDEARHLLVQAGTGTGKSLAYLVPAAQRALARERRRAPVVVATATLALQSQLVDRDLPALAPALESIVGEPLTWAIAKGRSNYACLHRVRDGAPDDDGALIPAAEAAASGSLGREVVRARRWAERQADTGGTGERDQLQPGVSDRAWAAVSVSAQECLGAARCPYGGECFAERARARAEKADVVVTNHALLAIHAIEGVPVLPEFDALVVDEGHELVARVTGVATGELTAAQVERAVRRARRFVDEDVADRLLDAAASVGDALAQARPGRQLSLPDSLVEAAVSLREAVRRAQSQVGKAGEDGPDDEAARRVAKAALDDLATVASRVAEQREQDVFWVEERDRGGALLRVAPLSVSGLIRDRLFGSATVVVTSATLTLGGSFDAISAGFGLGPADDGQWRGLDVGSPFDYPRQGILYTARHLPRPGRDGISAEAIDEMVGLVEAAGGRTLGLFSSRRAAESAAEAVRDRLPGVDILCQGDDLVPTLVRRFRTEPTTSLFGTLSLWQGVDVPGATCVLVIMDRIPFPRPDDPLMSARQQAVDAAGGNGFMAVSAAHAALLMAQGAGRLIRTGSDRGVLAVLDSRLSTARYGRFLRASLPAMWPTEDGSVVRAALRRLAAQHAVAEREAGAGEASPGGVDED
jgi:ATP-dependent DNA helicase DinG